MDFRILSVLDSGTKVRNVADAYISLNKLVQKILQLNFSEEFVELNES